MTILVGVLATDGAVIASDQAITFGQNAQIHTIADRMRKVSVLDKRWIIAGTGSVGMLQRFGNAMKGFSAALHHPHNLAKPASSPLKLANNGYTPAQVIADHLHQQNLKDDGVQVGAAMAQIMNHGLQTSNANRGQFGALAAYEAGGKAHLCEFSVSDFQPEQKTEQSWYASMGSGQTLADPYLALMRRTFWRNGQPNIEEAVFAAMWVIHHAIEAAPGFIAHPVDIAILKKWDGKNYSADLLPDEARDEHLNAVKAADDYLIEFRSKKATPPPPPPPPPSTH